MAANRPAEGQARGPGSGRRRAPVRDSRDPAPVVEIRRRKPWTELESGHELPLWRELFTSYDWLLLHTSVVWFGLGVPGGDGSAVVTVPGFLGTDLYLTEMNLWLDRLGYAAHRSDIGRNADCPNHLLERLAKTIEQAAGATGRRVHLIGHSLGGVIARSAAAQRPDLVASVTTLGSPFRGIRSHPIVLRTRDVVRWLMFGRPSAQFLPPACYTGRCTCAFVEGLEAFPSDVRELAIYTRGDGIVDWRMCITGARAKDREVLGTHIGLAFNPFVYQAVAEFLAAGRQP
jgi:triacylglycerol lipase